MAKARIGLAPRVNELFEKVINLECIKPLTLVGGTGLSIQIGTRQSEDLDFMRWRESKEDRLEIGWPAIKAELETISKIEKTDVLGFDQVLFIVDGVKLSFYVAPRYEVPELNRLNIEGNLFVADVKSIGVMKLETMSRRNRFKDYYDLYSILKEGYPLLDLVRLASIHSGHALKEKTILSIISDGDRFARESSFKELNPLYDINAKQIEEYIISSLPADMRVRK